MPHINELPPLTRAVDPTDQLIIEAAEGTRRINATAFKGTDGEHGSNGATGATGPPGETGPQGEPGGGSGGGSARVTTGFVTGVINQFATGTGVFALPKSSEILNVVLSGFARLRLYDTATARDADLGRSVYQTPIAGNGLILDLNSTAVLNQTLDPHAQASNADSPPATAIYYALQNHGASGVLSVSFTYLTKEI